MIDINSFKKTIADFDKKEKRTVFFKLAENLIKNGFQTEALLLILTTWNFATFRYAVKKFDAESFTNTLMKLKPTFDKFAGQQFQTLDLDSYRYDIETIYTTLSVIKGVEHTGAPKLMHLISPTVFVMWDSYIRGDKSKGFYEQLEIFNNKSYEMPNYERSSAGYFDFLKSMQKAYANFKWDEEKSLAKAIDEFNYVTITLPIQAAEQKAKAAKKGTNVHSEKNNTKAKSKI